MLHFFLSCIFLLSIVLWWGEAKYNFIYRKIIWLKDVCAWIKKQTRLKIDVCKWFLPCILTISTVYTLYYPYFKQTLEFTHGTFVIKDYSEERKDKELFSEQDNESIVNKQKTNPIGDWGTFGDFIGGTLNPIIGFISILLLFATWKLTRRTLDFTKEELKNSNQLLVSQQFDSLFFSVLQQLKYFEKILTEKNGRVCSELDDIYHNVFLKKFDYSLSYKREVLKENEILNQYFICLFQLYKMINNIYENETKNILLERSKTFSLEKKYSNILRSIVPMKLQQLLFLNVSEEFELYREYLNYYSFFEHMSFNRLDNKKGLNVDILALSENYKIFFKEENLDFKILGNSIHYSKLGNSIFFKLNKNNRKFINGLELVRYKFRFFDQITAFYSNKKKLLNYNAFYEYLLVKFTSDGLSLSRKQLEISSLEPLESNSLNVSYVDISYEIDGVEFNIDGINFFMFINNQRIPKIEKILGQSPQISNIKSFKEQLLDSSPTFIDVKKNPL
jgi:hypothetical protein